MRVASAAFVITDGALADADDVSQIILRHVPLAPNGNKSGTEIRACGFWSWHAGQRRGVVGRV